MSKTAPDQDEPTLVLFLKTSQGRRNRVTMTEQGGSNVTSKQCGDSISTVVGQIVHLYSRRDYVNKKWRNSGGGSHMHHVRISNILWLFDAVHLRINEYLI